MISRKLQEGLRRNQGRLRLPEFLDELSRSLNRPSESIQLLSLEKTDVLSEALVTEYRLRMNGSKDALRRIWPATQVSDLERGLNRLKGEVPDRQMVLFRFPSEYCGAVVSSSHEILENALRLVSPDQEDIRAVTEDLSWGMVLEYYTEWGPEGDAEVYELLVWGEEWLEALAGERSDGPPPPKTWEMNDKELESVLALPGERRYAYFIKRVADWEVLWSLTPDDGWVLVGDDEGHEIVPVWPHPRYAEACATGGWAGHEPRAIPLTEWLEVWTPGMLRDGRLVAVFPDRSSRGVVVSPDRLKADLEEEIELYV